MDKVMESIVSQLGVATHKFDEIGEFTYCLLLQGYKERAHQSHCCSVVVERTAKVTNLETFNLCFLSFNDCTTCSNYHFICCSDIYTPLIPDVLIFFFGPFNAPLVSAANSKKVIT